MNQRWVNERALETARAIAKRRPDYRIALVADLIEGDGARLVPGPGHPVPVRLCEPLIVVRITEDFGLYAVSFMPRATAVNAAIGGPRCPRGHALQAVMSHDREPMLACEQCQYAIDVPPSSPEADVMVYDSEYPILIR